MTYMRLLIRPVSLNIGTYLRLLCPADLKRQVSDR